MWRGVKKKGEEDRHTQLKQGSYLRSVLARRELGGAHECAVFLEAVDCVLWSGGLRICEVGIVT